jgi:hypothetical protein
MATTKREEILGKDGKPLFPGGLWKRTHKDNGFRTFEDENGKTYWLNDGEKDYVLPFVTVSKRNENGVFEKTYDSRCDLPPTDEA